MKAKAVPVAYSKVRFSTPDQAKGDSLRRQTEAAAAWCQANGVRLDERTTLHDLGRSAFKGVHRENPDRHALAGFLKLESAGKVVRGSYLVIENLDRLSREDIQPALLLVLGLRQAGVRVVQLIPATTVFTDKSDSMQVMMMVMELSRGHSESAVKSERVSRAWDRKRSEIGQRKMTGAAPFWLKLSADKMRFDVKPEAAALVRRIFDMARAGYGCQVTARKLNAEGIRTPRGKLWSHESVTNVLHNRAVLGEFVPHKGTPGNRTPLPLISDFYPRIMTDDEVYVAQASIAQRRKNGRGPRGQNVANLFTGLHRDALTGETFYLNTKKPGHVR